MCSKQNDVDVDVTMGRILRRTRLTSGLTLVSLAERCDVTYQQLQKYETGANRISVSRLFLLARALGVTPTEMIANVQEQVDSDEEQIIDARLEHLQFARPEYCQKIIASLASIDNIDVLESVVNLLNVLNQDNGHAEP
jgi:transcriptional regulator with XRE-family HTH domain